MSEHSKLKPVSLALGAAFATSLAGAGVATAADNPFAMTELSSGYMVADAHEGKCGEGMKSEAEGKCGEGMKSEAEGKCGEGMKSEAEGKCGGAKAEKAEGKCGEGMEDDEKAEKAEGKCGEGKCGGNR